MATYYSPKIVTDGLVFCLDAGNTKSYPARCFVSAKIYSVYNGGVRSANYTVQYSDDNTNWTTAFSGVARNNESGSATCGINNNTGSGSASYGRRRYWRYVEGSAIVSHHPRVSRIILVDDANIEYNLIVYVSDNCSDSGTYIVGTVSVDVGSTTWTDLSGSAANGTLTNGPTFNSDNKGSIVFDGIDDYIAGSLTSAPTEMTLCVFAKVTNKNEAGLIGIGTAGTYKEFWIELRSSGNFKVGLYSDDIAAGWSLSQSYSNLWTYFCGTINSAKLQTGYINGQSVGTYQGSNSYSGNSNCRVGFGRYSGGQYVNGNIAFAQIYNRALSATEILQNYNALRGRFGL